MAKQVQFRRGSNTENDTFTGAVGEITVDTTTNSLRVHDGTTAGGTSLGSYTKPSAEPISYITGLQTALDGKIDDSQVLTDVPLNALFTDTIGLAVDGDGSQLTNLPASSMGGTMTAHILPDTTETYDIGSAEYKIRHLFLSDNSLWVGDDHKVSVAGGKQRTKKRKKGKIPTLILDTLVGTAPKPFPTDADLKAKFKIDIHDPAPDPTVDPDHVDFQPLTHQWLHFAIINGMAGAITPENIFDNTDDFADDSDTTTSTTGPLTTSNPGSVGHFWINSTSGEAYVCTDASTDANVWTGISADLSNYVSTSSPAFNARLNGNGNDYYNFHPRVYNSYPTTGQVHSLNFLYPQYRLIFSGDATLTYTASIFGSTMMLMLKPNGHTITWSGSAFKWAGGTEPTWSEHTWWLIGLTYVDSGYVFCSPTGAT